MGNKSLKFKTCWEWSKDKFWNCYKWDEKDHFWYHLFQSLKMRNIVSNAEKYIKYIAWGTVRLEMHKKNLIKIFHGRGEFEKDKQE